MHLEQLTCYNTTLSPPWANKRWLPDTNATRCRGPHNHKNEGSEEEEGQLFYAVVGLRAAPQRAGNGAALRRAAKEPGVKAAGFAVGFIDGQGELRVTHASMNEAGGQKPVWFDEAWKAAKEGKFEKRSPKEAQSKNHPQKATKPERTNPPHPSTLKMG